MDRALSNFVQTGKFNFKELAGSIIQDLIRIQLRMQMMQLFGYGKGFLGNLFSGGQGDISQGISFQGAADGGYINSPTIVGEVGPELFIPRTAGTVVPNQQLSNVMGNQPQVIYNGPYIANMQAIDTQSASQFLAANKQAVWAANQSASRSLPSSR
jgi:phage-related minor tail protein